MIESFPGGATSSMVAKNLTKKLSQLLNELQGSKLEFKLLTPKSINGTYFETYLNWFSLAGLPMTTILDVGNAYFSAVSIATRLKFRF